MLWLVILQCLEEKGRSLLNTIATQEGFCSCLDIDEGSTFRIDKALGEVKGARWVRRKELAQLGGVVHLESNTCGVRDNLVVLLFSAMNHALNSLRVALCS